MLRGVWLLSLLFFLLFLAAGVSAQKVWRRGGTGWPFHHSGKSQVDTLYNGFESYSPTLFESPTGGYMNGTNGYGDQAKAQMFLADSSYLVLGAVYWFGYVRRTQPVGVSQIRLRMYRRDGIQPVNGVPAPVPGSWYEEQPLSVDQIPHGPELSTSGLVWLLDTARYVSGAYAFGFDLEDMHPLDTVALYSSDSGQVLRNNMSWEKWQGLWNTIANNWNLPVDFAIFPIVNLENAGFLEPLGGWRIALEGQPVRQDSRVRLDVPEPADFRLSLMSLEGRILAVKRLRLAAGSHWIPLDGLLPGSGLYFLMCTDGHRHGVVLRLVAY